MHRTRSLSFNFECLLQKIRFFFEENKFGALDIHLKNKFHSRSFFEVMHGKAY